ncbi:MAG: diguanylate cyclase [Oscillospiraceae bacterium]|nr:diguanylate cyclase [Oscillospiraceae bacterium]
MRIREKRTILIIDDSPSCVSTLTRVLSGTYNIIVAKCGHEGIETAKKKNPDLIILDIQMPDMDGYETITILKKTVSTRNIPVIFITALTKIEDEEKGLKLGGSDFITKPFSADIVKLRVNNQIRMLDYVSTIEQLSRIDQLTGLPNRRSFHERLTSEWKLAVREGTTLSVLVMDIDHFKNCNDTFGHLLGDAVLQKISTVIKDNARKPTDFAARWGGEEFIILLPKTNAEGAHLVAESIRDDIEHFTIIFKDNRKTKVTMSVGVNTHSPTRECSVNEFLHHADNALYAAKRNGRNNVTVHQPK